MKGSCFTLMDVRQTSKELIFLGEHLSHFLIGNGLWSQSSLVSHLSRPPDEGYKLEIIKIPDSHGSSRLHSICKLEDTGGLHVSREHLESHSRLVCLRERSNFEETAK